MLFLYHIKVLKRVYLGLCALCTDGENDIGAANMRNNFEEFSDFAIAILDFSLLYPI